MKTCTESPGSCWERVARAESLQGGPGRLHEAVKVKPTLLSTLEAAGL